ncbi:MAG: hypothetical protein ACYC4J_06160 [Gemmatimonadaceae bacterium]
MTVAQAQGQLVMRFSRTPMLVGTLEQVTMAPASPSVDFSFDSQDLLPRPTKWR